MNTEEDEFRRIEAEAKRRAAEAEDDDTQIYLKPWIGLTDGEIDKAWRIVNHTVPYAQYRLDVARAIEKTLKEKNT